MAKEIKAKNAAAPKAGALGLAFAELVIKAAIASGKLEEAKGQSRKDRLSQIVDMSNEDRAAVLARFAEEQQSINAMAAAMKLSLNQYMAGDPIQKSVYAETQLWKKMTKAVMTGWKPNLSVPWGVLSLEATDRLDAVGKRAKAKREREGTTATETPTVAAPTTRVGRKRKDVAKAVVQMVAEAMPKPVAVEGEQPKMRDLASVVAAMLEDATLEETQAVAATVERILKAKTEKVEAMTRIRGAAAKTMAEKNGDGEKPNVTPEPAPVAAKRSRKTERPAA